MEFLNRRLYCEIFFFLSRMYFRELRIHVFVFDIGLQLLRYMFGTSSGSRPTFGVTMEETASPNQWFFQHTENFSATATPSLAMPAVNPLTSCNEQQYYPHEVSNDQPKKSAKSTSLEPRLRRIRANNRERRRIQAINDAMEALRKAIPSTNNKRKLTKLELLRLAQEYIRQLSEMLCSSTSPFEDEVVNVSFSYPAYTNYFPETCFTN